MHINGGVNMKHNDKEHNEHNQGDSGNGDTLKPNLSGDEFNEMMGNKEHGHEHGHGGSCGGHGKGDGHGNGNGHKCCGKHHHKNHDGDSESGSESTAGSNQEVERLKLALEDANDRAVRAAAELENYKKRITKETDEKVKHANQKLVTDFLPIIDNLEMSVQYFGSVTDEHSKKVYDGIVLVIKQFKDALSKHGIKQIEIEPNVTKFHPDLHEAIALDADSSVGDDVITQVFQNGYTIHDRVARHSKVKVNKK